MLLTPDQYESVTYKIVLHFDKHFPSCESHYEGDNQIYFRKNDAEWFRIKFTPHPCT